MPTDYDLRVVQNRNTQYNRKTIQANPDTIPDTKQWGLCQPIQYLAVITKKLVKITTV